MYVMFLVALCARGGSLGVGHLATLVVMCITWGWAQSTMVAVNGVVAQDWYNVDHINVRNEEVVTYFVLGYWSEREIPLDISRIYDKPYNVGLNPQYRLMLGTTSRFIRFGLWYVCQDNI